MKKFAGIFLLLVFLVVALILIRNRNTKTFASLDQFASCLSESGAKMYGTKWCPYCKKEKESFGESFRIINYTECTENPRACTDIGINKLPTWIMGNGKKLEGLQGLEKLSAESGCALNPEI